MNNLTKDRFTVATLGTLVLVVAFFVLLSAPWVSAQTSRGTVTGTVTDPSSAVVPNATVILLNKNTNATRETHTNDVGLYRFDAVDLGTYDITAKMSGFKDAVAANVIVQANRIANIGFQLELGTGSLVVEVQATASEILQTTEPVRGANFTSRQVTQLPLVGLDSLTLILLVPGAQNAQTTQFSNGTYNFSVNGQRARSNNFLIDGVENNDISVAGPAYFLTNPDAVQEVSVQTTQFSAEFGRAGGAVVNQITKSGTNTFHGSVAWEYLSHVFNATGNQERLGTGRKSKFVENIPWFTVGGPIYIPHVYDGRNKTFFFAAGQWDRFFSSAQSSTRRVPTQAGVAVLQALAGSCPNVALYLQALGDFRGDPSVNPSNISIAIPAATFAATGSCNGTARTGQVVETGLAVERASQSALDNNHLIRIDHVASNKQTMSFRWLYDRSSQGPFFNNLPGFDRGFDGITLSMAFSDTYIINPHWTNEFRFNYGRIGFNFPGLATDDFHRTLQNYAISGVTGFGVATNIPQFRFANNWQYQDTMSIVKGRHQLRFGLDYLRQLARQHPPFNERGSFSYAASTGVAGLANFIDDLGGSGGNTQRQFGNSIYHPDLFRQAYFFQDTWKATTNLTLTLGIRYENFGQPANVFRIPAFTNWDPVNFAQPNKVKSDNNNFGPVLGFAWSPRYRSGILGRLFGDGKTVWRGGYQVTYDTWFNNLLSNIAGSSPNTLGGIIQSVSGAANPRGLARLSTQFSSIQATPPTVLSAQSSLFDPNIRNPYTQRYSFGFQRELPGKVVMDLSYVGSLGRKLFQTLDMNPIVAPPAVRFVNSVGVRSMRASSAKSSYNSLQLNVRRRYASTAIGPILLEGSYTWSHYIDQVSEVFATDSTPSSFQSAPQILGFSPNADRASSDNDRRHRLAINYVWEIRGPKSGMLGRILGGWTVSGISQFFTGAPITVINGADRNSDGQAGPDRPEIGNPNAPITSRAVIVGTTTCSTGFRNPDTASCVTPNDVHWLQGTGAPGPGTAGRNLVNAPGWARWDLDVIKRFRLTESVKLEYRAEIFNLFNRQNFQSFFLLGTSTVASPANAFMNFHLTEALGRSMRMQLKLVW